MPGSDSTVARGREFEDRAERWLHRQGLTTLERNFRAKVGELDLVMRDGSTVVFVEVRYRADARQGGALESVTAAKQRRLVHTAELWLQRHPAYAGKPARFDVVGIEGQRLDWIKDAFQAG